MQDWESKIIRLTTKIASDPENEVEYAEELIDLVEDLVISAYLKGKSAATAKLAKRNEPNKQKKVI